MSESSYFLGVVDYVFPGQRGNVGKLVPLWELAADGRTPVRRLSLADRTEAFPHTGRCSWYDLPAQATVGTLWWFRAGEAPTFDPTNRSHDQMRTAGTPEAAVEVIDVRSLGDAYLLRDALTGRGVRLYQTPTERVYLWTATGQWVGPVRLVPHKEAGYQWCIEESALSGTVPSIAAPDEGAVLTVDMDDARRTFVVPRPGIGQSVHRLDWATDDVILKRVLRWIRGKWPEYTDQLGMVKSAIDHAMATLGEVGVGGEDAELHGQRLVRTAAIVDALSDNVGLATAIVDDVIRLPRFQAELDARVAARADEIQQRALAEIDQELAAKRRERDELDERVKALLRDVDELDRMRREEEERIKQELQALEQQSETLEANREALRLQFEDRVQQLVSQPGALLADLAILRLVAPALLPGSATPNRRAGAGLEASAPAEEVSATALPPSAVSEAVDPSSTVERGAIAPPLPHPESDRNDALAGRHPERDGDISPTGSASSAARSGSGLGWPQPHAIGLASDAADAADDSTGASQVDEAGIRRAIRSAFRAARLPAGAGLSLHAATLAGCLPVLDGPGAMEAVEAYARVVAGGRLLRISVSPTTIEPVDLLGRIDMRGRFIPHPAGLMDLLLEAPAHDALAVVLLEGITRAPVDAYLTPLLDSYNAARLEGQARPVSVFHPKAIAADDPYAAGARLLWPRNVLLVATVAEGPATLPPSPDFWFRAAYLPLTRFHATALAAGHAAPMAGVPVDATVGAVPLRAWDAWRANVAANDADTYRQLVDQLTDTLPVYADTLGERLFAASRALAGSNEDALHDVIAGRLVARAAAAERVDDLRAVLKRADLWHDSFDDVAARVQRLAGT